MIMIIGTVDLLANVMIILMENNKIPVISKEKLDVYGETVCALLNDSSNTTKYVIEDNFDKKDWYKDFFEISNNQEYRLKDGITDKMLIDKFRWYLISKIYLAFINPEAIKILLK